MCCSFIHTGLYKTVPQSQLRSLAPVRLQILLSRTDWIQRWIQIVLTASVLKDPTSHRMSSLVVQCGRSHLGSFGTPVFPPLLWWPAEFISLAISASFYCWCVVLLKLVVWHYMLIRVSISRGGLKRAATTSKERGAGKILLVVKKKKKKTGPQVGCLVRRVKQQMLQHKVDVWVFSKRVMPDVAACGRQSHTCTSKGALTWVWRVSFSLSEKNFLFCFIQVAKHNEKKVDCLDLIVKKGIFLPANCSCY